MRTNDEIRRLRLDALLRETGMTLADLNSRLGKPRLDSTLSQIRNQAPSSTGQPRGMGDKIARSIEQATGKPTGWMDRDPDLDALQRRVEELESVARTTATPAAVYNTWPFRRVDAGRVRALPAARLAEVEATLLVAVTMAEQAAAAEASKARRA